MLQKEHCNYLFFILKRRYVYSAIKAFTKKARTKLARSIGINATPFPAYLIDIKGVDKKYKKQFGDKSEFSRLPEINTTIRLPSREFSLDNSIEWLIDFPDIEDILALHRWGWLIMSDDDFFLKSPITGLKLINHWYVIMSENRKHPAWESYSVSERIANAIIFLTITEQTLHRTSQEELIFARNILCEMGHYLFHNLEYFGDYNTYNHILNNARALYMLGIYLNKSEFQKAGSAIFQNELPGLLTSDGFLREDSSHYHMLLTRTCLEILWFSHIANDKGFFEWLKPYVDKMLERAGFFYVFSSDSTKTCMPLIGDVSPDCTISWLMDLPWSNLTKKFYGEVKPTHKDEITGWARLWNRIADVNFKNQQSAKACNYNDRPLFENFPASGAYRFNGTDITIVWHVNSDGFADYPSHCHNDTGSFCMFYKGKELITDLGRLNYEFSEIGNYGLSAQAHNSVIIDALAPFVAQKRNLFAEQYLMAEVKVKHFSEGKTFIFEICHNGFQRIYNDKITFKRTFKMSQNKVEIVDDLTGFKEHKVVSFFHLSPECKIETTAENQFNVKFNALGESFAFDIKGNADIKTDIIIGSPEEKTIEGWYFPEYGRKVVCPTFIIRAREKFPMVRNYSFRW